MPSVNAGVSAGNSHTALSDGYLAEMGLVLASSMS